ncbi:MAG: hypothetical protein JWN94_3512 [Betaproteobacteria bacterium]|nr:hypothetical protein [Betaproteobacteria bacterium]
MPATNSGSNVHPLPRRKRIRGRFFGWLLACALAIGPVAALVNWSVSLLVASRGCDNAAAAAESPLFLQHGADVADVADIVLIALSLAIAGILCAANAWHTLRAQSPGIIHSRAANRRPTWFLAICAAAGSMLFVATVILNAIALAVVPTCM